MIPKIIHYCWLSNDPYPEKIKKCMESWKRVLPDYEFVHWNFDRFPRGKCRWVDQAFDCKKYAFAADYIRTYALYNYGGIYLDTDVEVLKPFDDLLQLPYFYGREMPDSPIEAATMGCEKGNQLMKEVLALYAGRNFVNPDGTMNDDPMPVVFKRLIRHKGYSYREVKSIKDFVNDSNVINIFPISWFSPKEWASGKVQATNETYSIHQFYAGWMSRRAKFSLWLSRHTHPAVQYWSMYFLRNPIEIIRDVVRAVKRRACGLRDVRGDKWK